MEWLLIVTAAVGVAMVAKRYTGKTGLGAALRSVSSAVAPRKLDDDLEFYKIEAHSRPVNHMDTNHLKRPELNLFPDGQGKRVNAYHSYTILN